MLFGLLKKVVIADGLAGYVNWVYSDTSQQSGGPLLAATISFAFQIYYDFAGYTDIARGVAQILGFELVRNFDHPYLSTSVKEFWRRWHISLSSWFRDYLYIPLGGSMTSPARWAVNVLVVFVLSGLWHGASWTFVIWGALHGTLLIVERGLARGLKAMPALQGRLRVVLGRVWTLGWVTLAWISFARKACPRRWRSSARSGEMCFTPGCGPGGRLS